MRLYFFIATVLSALFGMLPIYIAVTTDAGDEICDPELYYSADRKCSLLWDQALVYFAIYFGLSAFVFLAFFMIWKLIARVLP